MTFAITAMAVTVGSAVSSGQMAGSTAHANNTVGRANAAAEKLMRDANNQLSAAQGSLARFNQSVNNQRIADQAGASAEAAMVNYRRGRDLATKGDFETQVKFAEQRGAMAAAAATSGLVGGVVDMVSATSILRESRIKQSVTEQLDQADYDAAKQQGQIMRAGLENMSTDSIVDNLDESVSFYQDQQRGGNLFTDVLGGLMSNTKNTANALGGIKSFFNTPEVVDGGYSIGQGSAYGPNGTIGTRKGL